MESRIKSFPLPQCAEKKKKESRKNIGHKGIVFRSESRVSEKSTERVFQGYNVMGCRACAECERGNEMF